MHAAHLLRDADDGERPEHAAVLAQPRAQPPGVAVSKVGALVEHVHEVAAAAERAPERLPVNLPMQPPRDRLELRPQLPWRQVPPRGLRLQEWKRWRLGERMVGLGEGSWMGVVRTGRALREALIEGGPPGC